MEYQTSPVAISKKLSSPKTIYDGVFSAASHAQPKFGKSSFEEYREIFGGSKGSSSIPFLDVPELNQRKASIDVKSSNLDYSNIFGGFGGFDGAVPYEELVAKPKKKRNKSFTGESRSSAVKSSPMKVLDNPGFLGENHIESPKASSQSVTGTKQSNMFNRKYSQGMSNEASGTADLAQRHAVPAYTSVVDKISVQQTTRKDQLLPSRNIQDIAQLHAVPAYTSVVDKVSLEQTMEDDKPLPSDDKDASNNHDSSKRMAGGTSNNQAVVLDRPHDAANKQTFEGAVKLENTSSWTKVSSNDKFDAYEINPKDLLKEPTTSKVTPNKSNAKVHFQSSQSSKVPVPQRSDAKITTGNFSPPGFDEEMDANSVAAASAAAVKAAIEKAQARIKMAKESMGKKKAGIQSSVKTSAKDGIRLEEYNDTEASSLSCEKKPQEVCEKVATQTQNPAGFGKQNLVETGQVASGVKSSQKQADTKGLPRGIETQGIRSMPVDQRCQRSEEWEAEKIFFEPVRENLDHPDASDQKMQSPDDCDLGEAYMTEENFERSPDYGEILEEVEKSYAREKSQGEPISSSRGEDQQSDVNKVNSAEQFSNHEGGEPPVGVDLDHQEIEKKLNTPEEEDYCREKMKLFEPVGNEKKVQLQEVEEVELEESLKEATEQTETKIEQEASFEAKENDGQSEENEIGLKATSGQEGDSIPTNHCNKVEYQKKLEEVALDEKPAEDHPIDAQRENDGIEKLAEICNQDIGGTSGGLHGGEQSERVVTEYGKLEINDDHVGDKEDQFPQQLCYLKENESCTENCGWTDSDSNQTEIDFEEDDEKIKETEEAYRCQENDAEDHDVCKQGHDDNSSELQEPSMPEENADHVDVIPEVLAQEENGRNIDVNEASFGPRECKSGSEAVEEVKEGEEHQRVGGGGFDFPAAEFNNFQEQMEDAAEMHFVQRQHEQDVEEPVAHNLGFESGQSSDTDKEAQVSVYRKEDNPSDESKCNADAENMEAAQMPSMSKVNSETMEMHKEVETSKTNRESHQTTLREQADALQGERAFDGQRPQGKDVAKQIEREKEKQRLAVERAMREARERAFAEARRKVMAETREQSEKVPIGTNGRPSAEKASMEAKIKAERAAVERATAEARERALKKALSEKVSLKSRSQADKFSGISKDNETRRAFSFNDSENKKDFVGLSSDLRRPDSSNHRVPSSSERFDGINGESAQRCKAVLERHQRTAERAAKALAEKNMRDLLAQKEQQERNRLAESLDADIKRWSSGKEKNLRALLSTLQYILGHDSGWQPTSLTDLVTAAAVRKAYRRATLGVHPDKLQQRGASIQQKYICEKVFDLLKEAWNRFSAEER